MMKLESIIKICEVGLRDGLQNEAIVPTAEQKYQLICNMVSAGFKSIEVGSFVSQKAVPQMANTDEVFRLIKGIDNVEFRALIANLKGVERAIECGCKKVKLNVSASKAHNLANLNMTPQKSVEGFKECVEIATKNGIEISGSISMAFGSPWDKEITLTDVIEVVVAYLNVGVTEISLSDASGMANPAQVFKFCVDLKNLFPEVSWWLHFHNTRGLGLSNILAGMQAGISQFDSSVSGIGGCPFVPGAAGNVCTEDLIHMCDEMKITTGIDLDSVLAIGKELVGKFGYRTDSYVLRAGKSKDLIRDLPKGQAINNSLNKK